MEKASKNPRAANNNDSPWWQPAVMMFARLSGWVVVPVLIGLFVGRYLDERFGTAPLGLLAAVGAAFTVSMIGIVLEAVKEYKKIEGTGKENKKTKHQAPKSK
jgi:F0F1-type ATP synthase assembly protein I